MHDNVVHAVSLFAEVEQANFYKLPAWIQAEFQAYLNNPKHQWNLKLKPQGTEFQLAVWARLRKIPVGETVTYGELAKELNSHPRAIGQACKKNPIPIIIPCHRVLSKQGNGGYSGATTGNKLEFKESLLRHERQ